MSNEQGPWKVCPSLDCWLVRRYSETAKQCYYKLSEAQDEAGRLNEIERVRDHAEELLAAYAPIEKRFNELGILGPGIKNMPEEGIITVQLSGVECRAILSAIQSAKGQQ